MGYKILSASACERSSKYTFVLAKKANKTFGKTDQEPMLDQLRGTK